MSGWSSVSPRARVAAVVVAAAAAAAVAAVVAGAVLLGGSEPSHAFASVLYEPAQPMPDIELTRHDGGQFRLSDYRGDVVVVYFGYTHCPDVCPLTLSNYRSAIEALPEDLRDDVRVVMVTVDPERDTAEVLANYVTRFDPSFVGATGSLRATQRALEGWRIRAEKEPVSGSDSYFMAHPASSYVIDRSGAKRLKVSHALTIDQIAADLRQVLEES